MVRVLKDASPAAQKVTIDASTPESFCRSLVRAQVIEVEPAYDAP